MKNNIHYFVSLLLLALLFISCDKDNTGNTDKDPALLSFSSMISSTITSKSHLNGLPNCSETDPGYVEFVLTGETNFGTAESPQVISIAPNPLDFDEDGVEEYISEALELRQGIYTLESFNIFDSDDNLIYMAPKTDEVFEQFVSNPLPQTIIIDTSEEYFYLVDIVCFDNRTLNE